jgi:hypothetical protein
MATQGPDLASQDQNGTPNWTVAQQQGHLRFAGLRAAFGMTADPWYATYRRQLDALGIPNFPYLAIHPEEGTFEAQAKNVLAIVGTLNNHYFPLALDIEGARNGLSAKQWLDGVTTVYRVVSDALGVPPLAYTSEVYWVDPDGMNNLPAGELANCVPWWKWWPYPVGSQAVYDPLAIDRLPAPPSPPPWKGSWVLTQQQGDAINYPGFRSTVDLNHVHVQRPGDTGASVKWIQSHFPTLVIDGVYGPKTEAEVRALQTRHKITVDGITGLDTSQLLSWISPRAIP